MFKFSKILKLCAYLTKYLRVSLKSCKDTLGSNNFYLQHKIIKLIIGVHAG